MNLLKEARPSGYLKSLEEEMLRPYPFSMLEDLKDTEQSPVYHPEGSVWNHTMLVIDEAAKRKNYSGDERMFMWAALLHDIGKPGTTKLRKGKITSYNHEIVGAAMARRFLGQFQEDPKFIEKTAALIRWHMQFLHIIKTPALADIEGMEKQVSITDAALLGLCDRLGRIGADREKEEHNLILFIERCRSRNDPKMQSP